MPSIDIRVREAVDSDVPGLHEIFAEVYGDDYPYRDFYDDDWLRRSIFNDNTTTLVAEEPSTGALLGTASVVRDIGAQSDLLGEFGRLAVLPHAGGRGVGKALMQKRIELAEQRLHVAIVENRVKHSFSQRISERYGFSPSGLLPLKHWFRAPESMALYVRHFGAALELRRNHPRIVPEAHELALRALAGCGLPSDPIVDEQSPPYAGEEDFEIKRLSAEGYPLLLRIERGRVRHREVFGALSLNQGFFKLRAKEAMYWVAERSGRGSGVAGAVGFTHAESESLIRVFELVAANDAVIPCLLSALVEFADGPARARYVEIDVSAYAPRLQRTLLALGFLPVAFVPAMVFHETERLDVLRMARIKSGQELGDMQLTERAAALCHPVVGLLRQRAVLPELTAAASHVTLLAGLSREQLARVAVGCSLATFDRGEALMKAGTSADAMFLLIRGNVRVLRGESDQEVGQVGAGQVVGEHALLTDEPHWATVVATEPIVAAVLTRDTLAELTRRRPDIALLLYKNLGLELGRKLRNVSSPPLPVTL